MNITPSSMNIVSAMNITGSQYSFIRRVNNILVEYCKSTLSKGELYGWIYEALEKQKEKADIGLVLSLMDGSHHDSKIAPKTSLSNFFIAEILEVDTSTPIRMFWGHHGFEDYPYATEAICQWRNNRNFINKPMRSIIINKPYTDLRHTLIIDASFPCELCD